MSSITEEQFNEKIESLDKKIEDMQNKISACISERDALILAKKSFFGKEKVSDQKNQKKEREIQTIVAILRKNGSIHYKRICELFNAACGTDKTEGAVLTFLWRLAKDPEMSIQKDPEQKGHFLLKEEKTTVTQTQTITGKSMIVENPNPPSEEVSTQ